MVLSFKENGSNYESEVRDMKFKLTGYLSDVGEISESKYFQL